MAKNTWLSDHQWDLFWKKVDKNGPIPDASADPLITAPPTPCWVWTAARRAGYGAFTPPRAIAKGNTGVAHRISYLEFVGEIPEKWHVDHLCRNRACVNPGHLEAVPHRTNLLRGETVPALRAAITHCPQGHEYTPANTYVSDKNQRYCSECRRLRMAEKRKDPAVREYYRVLSARRNARLRMELIAGGLK